MAGESLKSGGRIVYVVHTGAATDAAVCASETGREEEADESRFLDPAVGLGAVSMIDASPLRRFARGKIARLVNVSANLKRSV